VGFPGLNSIEVLVSDHIPDLERRQFRFPKSRRKRIRKKWANDEANYRLEKIKKPRMYQLGGQVFVGPGTLARLKEAIDEQHETRPPDSSLLEDFRRLLQMERPRNVDSQIPWTPFGLIPELDTEPEQPGLWFRGKR
jgi:hypothetical protein